MAHASGRSFSGDIHLADLHRNPSSNTSHTVVESPVRNPPTTDNRDDDARSDEHEAAPVYEELYLLPSDLFAKRVEIPEPER